MNENNAIGKLTQKFIWLLILLLGIIIGWIGKAWNERKKISKLIKKTIKDLMDIFKQTLEDKDKTIDEKDEIIKKLDAHIDELYNILKQYRGENPLLDSQLNKLPIIKEELNGLKSNIKNN